MRWHTLIGVVLLGAVGVAAAGEPGPPRPEPPERGMLGRGPRPGMMQQPGMMPGVPQEMVQFWQDVDPEFLIQLREEAEARPQQRGELLRRAFEEMRHLRELREREPERFALILQQRRLERQTHKLGAELRAAQDNAGKKRIMDELRSTLEQLFEVIEAIRERETKALEERIKELRDLAQKRRAHKAEIIDHRLKELSGELDYLRW